MRKTKKWFALALLTVMTCAAVFAAAQTAQAPARPFGRFAAENILTGEKVTEAYFQNAELTMVNYWATWCGPCVGELPALAKIGELTEGRVQVLGVQLDALSNGGKRDEDAIGAAKELFEASKAAYPSVVPDEWLTQIGTLVQSIPTTFFVDQNGNVLDAVIGSRSEQQWLDAIRERIGEKK